MRKNFYFWSVAIVGLIIDQLTKVWTILTFENVNDTIPIWEGVFHFTYIQNTGAAFSFFSGGAFWLRWLSLFVSLVLIVYGLWEKLPNPEQWGYGLILAGAFGNGVDRFIFGYLVDFLDFRWINFPVFNIADVCINIGIVFLIYGMFQEN